MNHARPVDIAQRPQYLIKCTGLVIHRKPGKYFTKVERPYRFIARPIEVAQSLEFYKTIYKSRSPVVFTGLVNLARPVDIMQRPQGLIKFTGLINHTRSVNISQSPQDLINKLQGRLKLHKVCNTIRPYICRQVMWFSQVW